MLPQMSFTNFGPPKLIVGTEGFTEGHDVDLHLKPICETSQFPTSPEFVFERLFVRIGYEPKIRYDGKKCLLRQP